MSALFAALLRVVPDGASPPPPPYRHTTFADLPDEVVAHIFAMLPPACSYHSREAWHAAAALAGTSKRYRAVYRASQRAVLLLADDAHGSPLTPDEMAALVRHAHTAYSATLEKPWSRVVDAVDALPDSLRVLRLCALTSRANLAPDKILACMRRMHHLAVLEIAYLYPVNFLGEVLTVVADVSPPLSELVVENLGFKPGTDQAARWSSTWLAVGETLRTLAVCKVQSNIMDRDFFRTLKSECRKLVGFRTDSGCFASAYLFGEALAELAPQLRSLTLITAPLHDIDAFALLGRCHALEAFRLPGSQCSEATFRRVVSSFGATLRELEMPSLLNLEDRDVAALVSCPLLSVLRIRRCNRLSRDAFPPQLCARLSALDIRDCPALGDDVLRTLASVRAPLREIRINESTVTQKGIECLLRACGRTLITLDLRFKRPASAPNRDELRKLVVLYCRGGPLERCYLY